MKSGATGLFLGALLVASMGLQAPMAFAHVDQIAANTVGTSRNIPNNDLSKRVPNNVNSAMGNLKTAYQHAASAQVEVAQGKFKDAANDIRSTENSLNKASMTRNLPRHLSLTIRNLQARLPRVRSSIEHQRTSARPELSSFMSAMAQSVGKIQAYSQPVGGGAGPVKKDTNK